MRAMVAILMAMALILATGSQAVLAQGAGKTPGETSPMTPQRGGDRPMGEMPMQSEGQVMAVPRAAEIIGLAVTNEQHQDLGKVEDLILSPDGRISYLVVSKGGVLGFGGKLCAIPWQASNPKIHDRALVVNISQERFEGAPTFANWLEFKEGGYESKVRAYYGEGTSFEGQRHGFESSPEKPIERTPSTTLPRESN
jgi:sporulation protein YlmC with PRC-barrel domain